MKNRFLNALLSDLTANDSEKGFNVAGFLECVELYLDFTRVGGRTLARPCQALRVGDPVMMRRPRSL
jgi:hypothetical protein